MATYSVDYDFSELPVMHCSLYAAGKAEIEYNTNYSGFVVRDIYLSAHDEKLSSGKRIRVGQDLHPVLAAALEEHDVQAINQCIVDDAAERISEWSNRA